MQVADAAVARLDEVGIPVIVKCPLTLYRDTVSLRFVAVWLERML